MPLNRRQSEGFTDFILTKLTDSSDKTEHRTDV